MDFALAALAISAGISWFGTFAANAQPIEIQLYTLVLTGVNLLVMLVALFYILPGLIECIHTPDANDVDDVDDVKNEDVEGGFFVERQIIETNPNGTVVIKTTYVPVSNRNSNPKETTEELHEMLEKTTPIQTPTQDTTEFADLLDAEKPTH